MRTMQLIASKSSSPSASNGGARCPKHCRAKHNAMHQSVRNNKIAIAVDLEPAGTAEIGANRCTNYHGAVRTWRGGRALHHTMVSVFCHDVVAAGIHHDSAWPEQLLQSVARAAHARDKAALTARIRRRAQQHPIISPLSDDIVAEGIEDQAVRYAQLGQTSSSATKPCHGFTL